MLLRTIAHQAVLLTIRHGASRIVLEKHYVFDHLGDCIVFKIFVLPIQFAKVLQLFLVIIRSFSQIKFQRLLRVGGKAQATRSSGFGAITPNCWRFLRYFLQKKTTKKYFKPILVKIIAYEHYT